MWQKTLMAWGPLLVSLSVPWGVWMSIWMDEGRINVTTLLTVRSSTNSDWNLNVIVRVAEV